MLLNLVKAMTGTSDIKTYRETDRQTDRDKEREKEREN